jgi:hypothetical protein
MRGQRWWVAATLGLLAGAGATRAARAWPADAPPDEAVPAETRDVETAAALRHEGQALLDRAAEARQRAELYDGFGAAAYKNRLPEQEWYRARRLERQAAQRFAAAAQIGRTVVQVEASQPLPPRAEKYQRMAHTFQRTGGGYVQRQNLVERYDALARRAAGLPPANRAVPPTPHERRAAGKPVEGFLESVK